MTPFDYILTLACALEAVALILALRKRKPRRDALGRFTSAAGLLPLSERRTHVHDLLRRAVGPK